MTPDGPPVEAEPVPPGEGDATLPATDEMERLDARLVPYWTLVNMLTTAFAVGALVLGVLYLRSRFEEHARWITIGGWAVGAFLLLSALLQPLLAYLTWRYAIDEQLLIARYGILFREEKTIPISRLQHVDLRRGPIERLFSLSTLVVFTAGTEGATFRVPGLSVDRSRQMRDLILAARGDDVI